MIKDFIKYFIGLWLLATFVGCCHLEIDPTDSKDRISVGFSAVVHALEAPSTRAITDDCAINNFAVWVFSDNKFVEAIYSDQIYTEDGQAHPMVRLDEDGKMFLMLQDGLRNVSLSMVANVSNIKTQEPALNTARENANARFSYSTDYMPMFGHNNKVFNVSPGVDGGAILLCRAMAKVEVDALKALNHFVLENIYIYYPNETGTVKKAPIVNETGTGTLSGTVITADNKGYLYLPEVNLATQSVYKSCIILEGKYKGETKYYKLDFIYHDDSSGEMRYYQLEELSRNYRYVFDIQYLTAETGYASLNDALANPASNTVPEGNIQLVKVYDADINDVTTNNYIYLGVTSSEVRAEKGNDYYVANINIVTNSNRGWKFETPLPAGVSLSVGEYVPDVAGEVVSVWVYIDKNMYSSGDVITLYVSGENIRKSINIKIQTGIANADELMIFASTYNSGGDISRWVDEDGVVKLLDDIDITGRKWVPIGNAAIDRDGVLQNQDVKPFTGVFDGCGHKIKGLRYTPDCTKLGRGSSLGFFGVLDGGTVKNLTIEVERIYAECPNQLFNIGGISGAAYNGSLISCCTVDVLNEQSIIASKQVLTGNTANFIGGIVGLVGGSAVESCVNKCPIKVNNVLNDNNGANSYHVGGICGFTMGTSSVKSCVNDAELGGMLRGEYWGDSPRMGGIVGTAHNDQVITIEDSTNNGKVLCTMITTSDKSSRSAGIIAYVGGEKSLIKGCVNNADVCFIREDLTGELYKGYVAGFVGQTNKFITIEECRNYGAILSDRWFYKQFEEGDGAYPAMGVALARPNKTSSIVKYCTIGGRMGPYSDPAKVVTFDAGNFSLYMLGDTFAARENIVLKGNVFAGDATEEIYYKFTGDIENTQLTSNNIVLPLGISHAVMQGFDMDRHGNIYISWEEDDGMHVRKFVGGKPVGEDMLLPTCGHGDCFCVEQDKNECYFWTVGSLGEPNGGFSGGLATDSAVRLTCRFKFEPGTVKYPEDAEECYYYNDNGCRECEIDQEHDIVALWGYSGSDMCKIYKLSDLKKASKITKKVTRKFNNGKEVSVYDLNSLTPVGSFKFQRKVICGTRVVNGKTQLHAIQGFTVYDGKVYFLAGYKNDPAATISVLDFSGKILQERTPVGLSADDDQLISLNLSSNGTFEPEGMHIRKGVMYLGFVGDYTTAGATKHSCILKME